MKNNGNRIVNKTVKQSDVILKIKHIL